MPERNYTPGHPLPSESTVSERIIKEPLPHVVAAGGVFTGVMLCLSVAFGFTISRSIDIFPWWISGLMGASYVIGGAFALIGLQYRGDDVSRGWSAQKVGWGQLCTTGIIYAVIVCISYPTSILSWGMPMLLGFGSGLQMVAMIIHDRSVRRSLDKLEGRDS